MSKDQIIEILMLLSALESWSYSTGKPLPDYLRDSLERCTGNLIDEVVG